VKEKSDRHFGNGISNLFASEALETSKLKKSEGREGQVSKGTKMMIIMVILMMKNGAE
jgi:hypothetical protein